MRSSAALALLLGAVIPAGSACTHATPAPEAPAARAAETAPLLGRWLITGEQGQKLLVLLPDGTGHFDGHPLRWRADGARLTMTDASGSDTNGWAVEGDRLVLVGAFGVRITFVRPPPPAEPGAGKGAGGPAPTPGR